MPKSEHVKWLYLLTFAILKQLAPKYGLNGKALLLEELYEKVFSVLDEAIFSLEARSER